jgi:maltooligosyltrehalose trehalohydrolase
MKIASEPLSSRADTRWRTLGAVAGGRGTTFRVWAPDRREVAVVLHDSPTGARSSAAPASGERPRPLRRDKSGLWTGTFDDIGPGRLYMLRLDGQVDETYPDPASRYQPFGVHGPSAVVDPDSFHWSDGRWVAPAFDQLVFYELHVGTFSPAGTFRGVTELLPRLAELGVTAIELMPVADFAGDRNWGYDGVTLFAPAHCYGTPDDLRMLVDTAHTCGLAVFLDVVYNHLGPDGAYANAFSPYYFTDAHESPWGRGVNLDGPHSEFVRRFFIENAIHWVSEYHIDGLRLDATHALVDDSHRHFLSELTSTVRRAVSTPVHFVAEDHRNLATLLKPIDRGGYGVDGVWADDFHHHARVHAAKDREGYYADFSGSTSDIARTLTQGWFFTGQHSNYLGHARGTDPSGLDPAHFVICIQNHDQIGNRADGARLNHQVDAATYRALSTLLLLAPQTPLIFMGQEWASRSPFMYFTDHHEALGRLITEGRRQEFSAFEAFADPESRDGIADPQARDTFVQSRLRWSEIEQPEHASMLRLYRRLLQLRGSLAVLGRRTPDSYVARALDDHTVVIDYRGGALVVVARISGAGTVAYDIPDTAVTILTSEEPGFATDAQPIGLRRDGRCQIDFRRPGAVVLGRNS